MFQSAFFLFAFANFYLIIALSCVMMNYLPIIDEQSMRCSDENKLQQTMENADR
jgi:hypothetical protein